MKIVMSSGHGKYIRGAAGYPVPPQLDEVDEARRVVDRVAEMWRTMGVNVTTFHDNTSHDQNTNLHTIVNFHNAQGPHDLDVSVHFNAYDGSAHGTECLYVSGNGQNYAAKVAPAIAGVGFTNRGPKQRTDLFFLNNTHEVAILIETCFCDNTGDSNTYRAKFEQVCEAIAESITGLSFGEPIEPPVEPPVEPVPPSGTNRLDFVVSGEGHFTVDFNGNAVDVGDGNEENRVDVTMAVKGDVVVTINGQEFHNFEPPEEEGVPPNQRDIYATWFGGSNDPNDSAYDGLPLNDTDLYVALPWNVSDSATRDRGIQVWNRRNGKTGVGKIRDKGPWMVDDNYSSIGTRPIAETCYNSRTPLPRGPNAGKVPANPAGLDLSPALFKALGMTDNGTVDWDWV